MLSTCVAGTDRRFSWKIINVGFNDHLPAAKHYGWIIVLVMIPKPLTSFTVSTFISGKNSLLNTFNIPHFTTIFSERTGNKSIKVKYVKTEYSIILFFRNIVLLYIYPVPFNCKIIILSPCFWFLPYEKIGKNVYTWKNEKVEFKPDLLHWIALYRWTKE